MEMASLATVKEGMSVDEVTKILGPSRSDWMTYYERRDELVMSWRYAMTRAS